MPAALVGRGQQDIGITRVEHHIGDAGVLADGQDSLPGLAAVGGFVQAAIAARPPERTLGRHVDSVRIAGIEDDAGDVLRLFQPHVLPGFAAIVGAVDAVAIGDATLAVVFSRADPDHVRIFGIEDHGADGVGAFAIEDRSPGGARVDSLPDTAGCGANVIRALVAGVDGEGDHASGSDRRTDGAELESGECIGRKEVGGLVGFLRAGEGQGDQQGEEKSGTWQQHREKYSRARVCALGGWWLVAGGWWFCLACLARRYIFPLNRYTSSITRITTTISSRTKARACWNWSTMNW